MNVDKVALIGNVTHYCLSEIEMRLQLIGGDNSMVDQNIFCMV